MRTTSRYALYAAALIGPVAAWVLVPSPRQQQKPAAVARPPAAVPKKPAAKPKPPQPPPQPPPQRLAVPPEIVRGVYLTSWSAGLKRRIDSVLQLQRDADINAVVIDIKDYSGYLTYRMALPDAQRYGAFRITVRNIDAVVNRFHNAGIYVIARITVFQDPILARARPEWAVHRASLLKASKVGANADTLWLDRKGLAWIDPASRPAWDYVIRIGRDALAHGFDELNFDYVRFPSDGNLKDMHFPVWDGKTPKSAVIASFFQHLRKELDGVPISADLFGLAAVNDDDLGIGQVIEHAYKNFDYVCPMVYPSHFARGFRNFTNPADHPYEVIHYSMEKAALRLRALRPAPVADGQANGNAKDPAPVKLARLRPWLQDFDLGARYDREKIQAQIQATKEALGDDYAGYLIWAPSNVYSSAALK